MTEAHLPDQGRRLIFHAAGVPMLLVDPASGLIEDANDAACRFYGYARDGLVGKPLATISTSTPERLRDAMAIALDGERLYAVDHITATGRVMPVQVVSAPVQLQDRRQIVEVITPRSPEEEARTTLALLYEATADIHGAIVRAGSEAELWSEAARIVVEVAGFHVAWVAMVDAVAGLARVAAAAGAVGYLEGRDDRLGTDDPTPIALAIAEGRTVVVDDMASASGPYGPRALEFGFRSGAVVPMREGDAPPFGALVVLENRPAALAGERVALLERIASDLAVARTLMHTAERLRKSEERYRSLVEGASAGIMVFGPQGKVLEANPAACAMLGYTRAELRAAGSAFVVHDLSVDEEAGLLEVLQSGAAVWVDRRFRRADGEVITVAFNGRLLEDGTVEAVVQDVTADRRAEAALRASEARYRGLVGVLQEGVITYDADGRVTEMNDAARWLYSDRDEDFVGRDARDLAAGFIQPDGTPFALDDLPTQVVLRTGRPTSQALIGAPQADGSIRWISSSAAPTGVDADGRPSGIVVSFAEVTELREALARATASEDRVRRLVDEAFDGVIVLDPSGAIEYANPATERILEVPAGMLLGHSLVDVMPPEQREQLAKDLAWIAQGNVFEGEYPAVRSDGAELAIEVTASLLADGRIEVIARNVTARKALEAERDRLAQAAEQASDAIYITDAAGVITYVNRAYERMNRYLREEVVGRTPEVHRAPEQAVLEAEIVVALDANGMWAGEVTHRAKDGTRHRVSSRIVALRDAMGRVTGRVAIARDISLEREQDARLAQAARLEAIAQLAGGVAHDLNNVLTMIVGHASLLDPATATPADIADGVHAITEAAGQAEQLTNRLLAFGRRRVLRPRPADLRDLLSDAQPILARAVGSRVALVISLGSDAVPVNLDPNLFEQALLALAVHARDAMPDGGALRIAAARPAPGEGLPNGDSIVLTVADNGPGVAPDALDRMFEPFAEIGADEPGLGLAMVHGFVHASGGRIEVSSVPGSGTAFRIVLPLRHVEDEPGRPEPASQPARSGAAVVLVVEDEPVLRQVAERTLARRGHQVLLAASGEEALAVASAHQGRIDLLFSDVAMPGLRGPGLAAALLRMRPDMRVLLTSGYDEDAAGMRGIESAPGEFLAKPYTPAVLAATVERLLADEPR